MTDDDAIRTRAYQLWEEEGRPDGCDEHHWHEASRLVGNAHAPARAAGFQTYIGGLVLAAVVFTATAQELTRFTNAVALGVGGFFLAMGLFAFYQLDVRATLHPNLRPIAAVLAGLGIAILIGTFAGAIVTEQDFEVACATQQARMLKGDAALGIATSGPASGAATFQAWRCDYAS